MDRKDPDDDQTLNPELARPAVSMPGLPGTAAAPQTSRRGYLRRLQPPGAQPARSRRRPRGSAPAPCPQPGANGRRSAQPADQGRRPAGTRRPSANARLEPIPLTRSDAHHALPAHPRGRSIRLRPGTDQPRRRASHLPSGRAPNEPGGRMLRRPARPGRRRPADPGRHLGTSPAKQE